MVKRQNVDIGSIPMARVVKIDYLSIIIINVSISNR